MATVSTQFELELKKIIAEEISHLSDVLTDGRAIPDFAAYRFHAGQIAALIRVRDTYCEDAQTLVEKR